MKRLEFWIIGGVLALSSLLIFAFSDKFTPPQKPEKITYSIEKTWEMPKVLNEISGLSWLGDNKIATVQDEDGSIFIYDLKQDKITETIDFAGNGDYEALEIYKGAAYVMRSDGTLFEIEDYLGKNKRLKKYEIPSFKKSNIEAMTVDARYNRLLIAPKDRDPNDEAYKGVYVFDLETKKFDKKPLLKIDLKLMEFNDFKQKKDWKTFRPSAMAVHPKTHDLYMLEGVNPKLLIFNENGALQKIHLLDANDFPQPEGIAFSEEGTLYISNEAVNGAATILEVVLN